MKRIKWIDVSKAIGIVLVVYAHALTKNTFVWNVIQQFHMPLFFVLSGYLFVGCSINKQLFIKKMKSLWFPFVIVNIISYIILSFSNINIIDVIKIVFMLKTSGVFGATWFLGSLFYISVFVAMMYKIINTFRQKLIVLIVVNIVLIIIFMVLGFYIPIKSYHLSATLMGTGYYLLGYNLKITNAINQLFNYNMIIKILIIFICISLLLCISTINKCSFSSGIYSNSLLSVVSALSGVLSVLLLSGMFCNSFLSKIGCYSLEIMIWHLFAFKLVILIQILIYQLDFMVINSYPYYDNHGIWLYILTVIGLIVPIYMSKMYNYFVKKNKYDIF